MLLVIQPLKKYLTEHESETLSTCYDKYLASCQDAQRPLSKTASLPEGKCILLLYLVLLSTVQQWGNGSGTIQFPVSFGTVFSVLASPISRTSSLETGYVISKQSNTGITIHRIILWNTQANGGDLSGSSKYNWVAMGVA